MPKLTQADQYGTVGDGLALGCHDIGIAGITASKLELELSFNHAWRNFPPAARTFPQVNATLARCDILTILRKSSGRKWSIVEWHQHGPWWQPEPRGILDYDDIAEMIAGSSGVSRDQWRDMVEAFAGRLGDAHALHAS
ncbi:hypothetical protein ACIBSS_32100 [Micromonospora aurantiaca]|uniref:hypothetical protein n=1 Tax=Micromonospora aurantiaca (nom. illeg.) TaxID=47850 RepID=UPI0037A77239